MGENVVEDEDADKWIDRETEEDVEGEKQAANLGRPSPLSGPPLQGKFH